MRQQLLVQVLVQFKKYSNYVPTTIPKKFGTLDPATLKLDL